MGAAPLLGPGGRFAATASAAGYRLADTLVTPHGVPVTAKTLTPVAALVLAIGVIHRADVLLYGAGGGPSWATKRSP